VNTTEYTRQYAYGAVEMGIVVAASVANHLASLRQEVGLLTNGVDPADPRLTGLAGYLPRKGRGQLTSILELLGRVTVVSDRPFWPSLRGEIKRMPWGATLVVVTPRESEELLETTVPLLRAGFNVVLIYVDYPNPEVYEVAHRRAAVLGMRAYRVWREEDVDVWRR